MPPNTNAQTIISLWGATRDLIEVSWHGPAPGKRWADAMVRLKRVI